EGKYIEQTYTLAPETYKIDYAIHMAGLQDILAPNTSEISLNWVNYLDRIEINTKYERNYSTVYYKIAENDPTYCSCTADDTEELTDIPLRWVSHVNQFFNSSLIAESQNFKGAKLETKLLDEKGADLKKLTSSIKLPYDGAAGEPFKMVFYVGPNEFDRLYAMGDDLQDVIPFGRSIFGTINRWVIRPIFNFLSGFIGSKGIVILFLTLFVKLLVYPLTYKMIYSQSKMGALKPQIAALKEKFKDDAQQQQMETMKMYREFGVNPLGGCFPMLLQMPIWFALYRFFPASIEFRQAPFLWAHDLSSYDVIMRLPFEIPMGFGAHISLFTMLWAVSTLAYTYYNSQHMDFSSQPAMKYMQYIMPILFLGFFNSFASGLTCYLLFSNLLNIGQTLITKNFLINEDKIRLMLEENKKKPKKKTGFQARLETAMKEQQRLQAAKEQEKKKGNKK
ncbi:MAG: membrane protein insertase YidC, partial [Saprospiraceae bacterium]|nr:membrane protein insertase YidC [Saprospiraceae bacterium]